MWATAHHSRLRNIDHSLRILKPRSLQKREPFVVRLPANAVSDDDPCSDSFALDEFECILLSVLREWARSSPTTAVPGITRSIIRFVENVIPDPDDHGDTRATLEAMRDEDLALAHAVHSAPGAHR